MNKITLKHKGIKGSYVEMNIMSRRVGQSIYLADIN